MSRRKFLGVLVAFLLAVPLAVLAVDIAFAKIAK